MTAAVRILVLAGLVAAATLLGGWWAVPLVGFAAGLVLGEARGPGVRAALAGALAWGVLLAWTATQGPVGAVASAVGPVLRVGPWGLFAVTLAFPALLAGSAAVLGAALRDARKLSGPSGP